MGFARVVAAHLLEDPKPLFKLMLGNTSLDHSGQCLFIRINCRRKPERRAQVAVNVVGAVVFKRLTGECPDEARKIPQALMRIGIEPAAAGSALKASATVLTA